MKIKIVIALCFLCSFSFGQYAYQNANSIIVNSNYDTRAASAEGSFEFNHFQFTGIYNVTKKIFLHSTLKLNVLQQNAEKYAPDIFGNDPTKLHTNDVGFGIGFGLQNLGKMGKLNTQLVFGYDYENQKYNFKESRLDRYDNLVDSTSNQHNTLYKISSNFNLVNSNEKYNVVYLLRLTYFNFIKFRYNNVDAVVSNTDFILAEPAVEIDFKLLKTRKLFITSQFGLSVPFGKLDYSYKADLPFDATTDTYQSLYDIILKLGIKYNF